jgi:hypothetical protein
VSLPIILGPSSPAPATVPGASTDGSLTKNTNKIGARLWALAGSQIEDIVQHAEVKQPVRPGW